MRPKFFLAAAAIAIVALSSAYVSVSAQATQRTVWDGVYTVQQANHGRAIYQQRCASCHGDGLEGADVAPALAGARFRANWTGQTIADLTTRTRTTMPLDNPGSLGVADVTDITAYMLMANNFPAGATPLPREGAAQRQIRVAPRR